MSGSSLEIMICDLHPLDGGEYDVTDSDGFVWLFHTRVVEVFNLDEGRLVASETLMHAAVASSLLRARMLVRTILGRTRKPVPRLETDLRSRGIGEVDADCALRLALLTGLVDDLGWARDLVEIRHERRGEGPAAIRFWLEQRGFDRDVIRQALEHLAELADPLETACALLAERFPAGSADPALRQKAWGFLARRGHSFEVIGKALRRHFSGSDPDDW
ncbi:MAG TPA: regulatory protein RecX [Spirochaetota bacterium]|nr:regulatory protein RecX [Spirochaetota bacterium]